MGIIQKTRDNSALMLIVIGGALLAFILTEYLSSNNSSNELNNTVGEFNGIEITDSEFSDEREKLTFLTNGGESFSATQEFQKGQLTNEAWNSILRDKFLENEAEELGIKVTSDEEEEMLIGNAETGAQPSPFYVNYLFGGSEYYQKNRNEIAQNTADVSKHAFMAVFNRNRELVNRIALGNSSLWVREFGIKLREQDKLQRLLSNCFYTTNSLAKDEFLASNSNKDIEIGFVKYSSVDDESIEPTE
jgi:peptidyl-prolyl cis-trans isomerase D